MRFVVLIVGCAALPPALFGGASERLVYEDGHLIMQATIDGKPAHFVIDTGASITSLTTAGATRFGIVADGGTRVGDVATPTGTIRTLELGGERHDRVRVAIVDMPESRRLGSRMDGIVGLDVLARHDIVVDRSRNTLAIHPTGTLARMSEMAGMTRVPIEHGAHGLILLAIELDGVPVRAVLDLGAPVSYLNSAASAVTARQRSHRFVIGDVDVRTYFAFVEDLPVFARCGLAGQPAVLLGSDVFDDRTLAIAYGDRLAFVSR